MFREIRALSREFGYVMENSIKSLLKLSVGVPRNADHLETEGLYSRITTRPDCRRVGRRDSHNGQLWLVDQDSLPIIDTRLDTEFKCFRR